MSFYNNISNAIDSFSFKRFDGNDSLTIEVPNQTALYISVTLNIVCSRVFGETISFTDDVWTRRNVDNQLTMYKKKLNNIDGEVSPKFLQELKKAVRCYMLSLTADWEEASKEEKHYCCADPTEHFSIKRHHDNTYQHADNLILMQFAEVKGFNYNSPLKYNKAIRIESVIKKDNELWTFLCGDPKNISCFFNLMRSEIEGVSLVNITVSYIVNNINKFEGKLSTLPADLIEKIKENARYGIKKS